MVEQMNSVAIGWWGWMWPMFWQVGVLVLIVGAIDFGVRRWVWPQVRYSLWLLVLVKLIMPPGLALETSVTSDIGGYAENYFAAEAEEGIEAQGHRGTEVEGTPENYLAYDREEAGSRQGEDVAVESGGVYNREGLAEAEQREIGLDWRFWVMGSWFLGFWVLGGWLVVRLSGLRAMYGVKNGDREVPEWLGEVLVETAQRVGLKRVPLLVLSERVNCPAVFGCFRPVLLLPAGQIEKLSRDEAEHVLLHELSHVRRGDLWVHGFWMVLQVVYWFHPMLWWAGRQMRHVRELCCDASVAKLLRERTVAYRATLLETARRLLDRPVEPGLGLLGLFEDSNRLLARLNWLEKKTWRYRPLRIATVLLVVGLMVGCVLPMASGTRQGAKADLNSTFDFGDDVSVTILGITTYPISDDSQWWGVDGQVLDEAPVKVDVTSMDASGFAHAKDRNPFVMVYSKQRPEDVTVRVRAKLMSGADVSMPFGQGLKGGNELNVLDVDKETVTNAGLVLSVSVANGVWETGETFDWTKTKGKGFVGLARGNKIISSQLVGGRTVVTISYTGELHNSDGDVRVVAIDEKGRTYSSNGGGSLSVSDGLSVKSFEFDVPRQKMDHLEIQHRPFKTFKIRPVSLVPGQKTDVAVELENPEGDFQKVIENIKRSFGYKEPHGSQGPSTVDEFEVPKNYFSQLVEAYDGEDLDQVNDFATAMRDWFRGYETSHSLQSEAVETIEQLAELSDDLHDAIRDEKMYLVPGMYLNLTKAWQGFMPMEMTPEGDGAVSQHMMYYIVGDILRPGPYRVDQADRLNLLQALSAAAVRNDLKGKYVDLLRTEEDQEITVAHRLSTNDLYSGKTRNIVILPGDVIRVYTEPHEPQVHPVETSVGKEFPDEYVGHWVGGAKIIVSWCEQKRLPIDIEIHADGRVSGTVGDARLKDAVLAKKSWVYTKVFKHENPYRITGDLEGEIVKGENIKRDSIFIGLRVEDGKIDGGLGTSGTKVGGKASMMLSAVDVSLVRPS